MTPIRLLLFVGVLCAGCTTTDQQGFLVVDGTKSIDKVDRRNSDNVYPWERIEADKDKGTILVSNSCGFAHVIYERADNLERREETSTSVKTWGGLETVGEWCKIGDLVVDNEALIRFRRWRGNNYILETGYEDIHRITV